MNKTGGKIAAAKGPASRRSSTASEESTCVKEPWHEALSESLENRIDRLEEQMEEIRVDLDSRTQNDANTSLLKQDFLKSQRAVEDLKRQLKKSQNDLAETTRQVQVLKHKSQADQAKLKDLEEKEQKLVKHLRSLEEQLDKKEATIRKMQKQIENMQKEIVSGQNALKMAEVQFQKKLDDIANRYEDRFKQIEDRLAGGTSSAGTGDVTRREVILNDVSDDIAARPPGGCMHLPPISYPKMNFPPRK